MVQTPAMTSPAAPPVFLHIGRGKSGSSTIQSLAGDHADFMRALGIVCPLTVHGIPNHARLASALYSPKSDRATLKKFRKDVTKHQRRKIFISAEALFSLTRPSLERLKKLMGDRETRILCYIRDYPSWLQSIYAQRTKRATNPVDFDSFYSSIRKNISVMPRLERWADAFGWDAMRVRPLDQQVLVGGDLICDVLHALGVENPSLKVKSLNLAPHWMTLELQRALLLAAKSAPIGEIDARSARATRDLFERCAAGVEPSRVQYLTKEQWVDLAQLYTEDMEALGKLMGVPFQISLREPEERPFLPDFAAIPASVKDDVRTRLHQPEYAVRIQPQVADLLQGLLDRP
jgi:hypothetical protein